MIHLMSHAQYTWSSSNFISKRKKLTNDTFTPLIFGPFSSNSNDEDIGPEHLYKTYLSIHLNF